MKMDCIGDKLESAYQQVIAKKKDDKSELEQLKQRQSYRDLFLDILKIGPASDYIKRWGIMLVFTLGHEMILSLKN